MRTNRSRTLIAGAALTMLATVGATACGDDDNDVVADVAETSAYCTNANALGTGFDGTDVAAVPPGGALQPDVAAAAVGTLGGLLDEAESSAPSEIRSDMATVIAAIRAAANGDLTLAQAPDYEDARQEVLAYQVDSCPSGSSSGDG